MPAALQDLVIEQAATNVLVVTVVGGPPTLLGYTGHMQVRERKSETSTVLAEISNAEMTIDPDNRQVVVTIPSSLSSGYDWTEGYYDLYVIAPGGERWRLVEGKARLSRTVTREA
jgi:hypothetical protein